MFDRVFPERQIYHRSGGTVHYISVSPWQQAMLAAGVTAIAGWTAVTTVSYVFGPSGNYDMAENGESAARYQRWIQELRANTALSRTLLEERTEDFQRVTAEFEERHQALTVILEALESGKDLDITTLRGDDADLMLDATIDEADARQGLQRAMPGASLEVVGVRARIDELETSQEAWLNQAEDIVVERAERARGILRLTAVGSGRIEDSRAMGGPEVSIAELTSSMADDPDAAFERRVLQVAARLEEAKYYEDIVASLPLAEPTGVPARLTSNYGMRVDPFTRRPAWHNGIDMAAYYKAPIAAAGPGTVTYAGRMSGYGRMVEVNHGYGFKSRYAHMQSISVSRGDTVAIGDTLGLMGSSGRSTGPHLHYEVYFNDKPYDPVDFLKAGRHVHQDQ
ncbi:MAG: M23 family metallopeptidase [Hyphomonadaceae bacterium]|nr:M23 family metallopeptidase [Hyphomonadaceae bacterium]